MLLLFKLKHARQFQEKRHRAPFTYSSPLFQNAVAYQLSELWQSSDNSVVSARQILETTKEEVPVFVEVEEVI